MVEEELTAVVRTVSHDIRGSLAAILGAAEILVDEGDRAGRVEFFDIIRSQSEAIVTKLDYLKIQTGGGSS